MNEVSGCVCACVWKVLSIDENHTNIYPAYAAVDV